MAYNILYRKTQDQGLYVSDILITNVTHLYQ